MAYRSSKTEGPPTPCGTWRAFCLEAPVRYIETTFCCAGGAGRALDEPQVLRLELSAECHKSKERGTH
jgi:hypothetical protein